MASLKLKDQVRPMGEPQDGKQKWIVATDNRKEHITFELDEGYVIHKVIGVGGYGMVCAAYHKDRPEEPLALKRIVVKNCAILRIERTIREIQIMNKLNRHPFIVEFKGVMTPPAFKSFGDVFLLMKRMKTNLRDIIKCNNSTRGNKLNTDNVKIYMAQILRALQYVHAGGILHRDLKPHNILVGEVNGDDENLRVKLCDFGISRNIAAEMTTHVGTAPYRPPEHFLRTDSFVDYGPPTDVWAVGCIFAEMFTRDAKPLFGGINDQQDIKTNLQRFGEVIPIHRIELWKYTQDRANADELRNALPTWPPNPLARMFRHVKDESVIDLMERMLKFDPQKRITVDEALQHEFLADITVDFLAEKLELTTPEVNMLRRVKPPDYGIKELKGCEETIEGKEKLRELLYMICKRFKVNDDSSRIAERDP